MITRVFPWLRPSRRGSAILLAVGCLAMLAILGMAYLISARSESRSATYVAAASNYDGARDRMLEHFRSRIFHATIAPLDTANADQIPVADARPLSGYWRSNDKPIGLNPPRTIVLNPPLSYNYYGPGGHVGRGSTSVVYYSDSDPKLNTPIFVSGLTPDDISSIPAGSYDSVGLTDSINTKGTVSGYINFMGAARLADTSRMINLNVAVGANNGVYPDIDADGRYWFGYRMRMPNDSDNDPSIILSARDTAVNTMQTWQQKLRNLPTDNLRLFDFQDEIELRSYGHRGTGLNTRLVQLWKTTLPFSLSSDLRSTNAKKYTVYSYDRDNLRPLNNHPVVGAVTNVNGGTVLPLPPDGRRIPINPHVPGGQFNDINAKVVAENARYLASAMLLCGYGKDDAYGFAANYASQRGNAIGMADDTGVVLGQPPTAFTDGLAGSSPGDMPGPATPTFRYYGVRPQPFITEMGVRVRDQNPAPLADPTNTPGTWGKTDIEAWGIEMFNPYPTAVDLTGWKLWLIGQNNALGVVNLSGVLGTNSTKVFASELAFVAPGAQPSAIIDNTVRLSQPAGAAFVPGSFTSYRVYLTRPVNGVNVPVDSMDYGRMYPASLPPAAATYYFVRRPGAGPWNCMVNVVNTHSIGSVVGSYPDGAANGFIFPRSPLPTPYDNRNLFASVMTDRYVGAVTPSDPMSFRDFHRTWRVAHKVDLINWDNSVLLGDTLRERWQYFTPFPAPPATPDAGFGPGINPNGNHQWIVDASVRLKFHQAWHALDARPDRLSNYLRFQGFDTGALTATETQAGRLVTILDRDRIPGRININTASAEVLTILFASVLDATTNPDLTPFTNTAFTATGSTNLDIQAAWWANQIVAWRNNTSQPFRDLKELSLFFINRVNQIPLNNLKENRTMTLDQFDALWVRLYPLITFRSDTFVLWGYVVNYEAGSGNIGVQQGGARRFMALYDASWANRAPSEGGNPQDVRILAVKDMPR